MRFRKRLFIYGLSLVFMVMLVKLRLHHQSSTKISKDPEQILPAAKHYIEPSLVSSLLRRNPHSSVAELSDRISIKDGCREFVREGSAEYNVAWNYFKAEDIHQGITLVSQCSDDKLDRVVALTKVWPGPISIAVYFVEGTAVNETLMEQLSELRRSNIQIHLAFHNEEQRPLFYPVNHMRNVALKVAMTEHVFLLDIDFYELIPILYDRLLYWSRSDLLTDQTVFVTPSFSQFYVKPVVETKTELVKQVKQKLYFPFEEKGGGGGCNSTNYTRWYEANEPYQVDFSFVYEPYVLVRRSKYLPAYDERFVGYGFNKNSYFNAIAARGYRFIVLPDVYVVHRGHTISKAFAPRQQFRYCMQNTVWRYCDELALTVEKHSNLYEIFTKQCQKF